MNDCHGVGGFTPGDLLVCVSADPGWQWWQWWMCSVCVFVADASSARPELFEAALRRPCPMRMSDRMYYDGAVIVIRDGTLDWAWHGEASWRFERVGSVGDASG